MIPLQVKWGKETIELSYDPATGYQGLVQELSEKTAVPVARMKVMAKTKGLWKGVLKEDTAVTWPTTTSDNTKIQLLLMGSAAQLTGPKTKTVFVEDLPPEEVARVVAEPSGLVNLGNTCYLNSVVQCLRAVDPLRKGLQAYRPSASQAGMATNNMQGPLLVTSLQNTLQQMDRQTDALNPMSLVQATKMVFPQFNQRGPHGQPMQQDAEEFYSGLLETMARETHQVLAAALPTANADALQGADNLVDALFGIKLQETLTCTETEQEPAVIKLDRARKLTCSIQGGSDAQAVTNVSHVAEGIALSLEEGNVEKHSAVLQRNALWKRTQRMARLPPILVVQFVRFYWKATPDSADHPNGVKCKVMKPVAFTTTLDVYEFCSADVQTILKRHRDAAIKAEEERLFAKSQKQDKDDDAMQQDDEDLQAALAMSMQTDEDDADKPVGPGLPKDFQGLYELFGVVTHKGREADGGHYMSWVRAPGGDNDKREKIADTDEYNDDWFVFDDDEVSPCKTEDVLKLKGGGDYHMSYLNFYRAKK